MVTINPKKRHDEIMEKRTARHEEVPAENRYHCVEVLTWKQLSAELNYWAQHGWRVLTVRDGVRNGSEFGYRIILERDRLV